MALPAAVGVSLADEKLPVVALIGDGSANYSITGLWTASRLKLPSTFVIIRNGVYEVLSDYGNFLGIEGVPGMALPGLDLVSLAAVYGLPGHRVTNQNDFGDSLRATISSGAPSLL